MTLPTNRQSRGQRSVHHRTHLKHHQQNIPVIFSHGRPLRAELEAVEFLSSYIRVSAHMRQVRRGRTVPGRGPGFNCTV